MVLCFWCLRATAFLKVARLLGLFVPPAQVLLHPLLSDRYAPGLEDTPTCRSQSLSACVLSVVAWQVAGPSDSGSCGVWTQAYVNPAQCARAGDHFRHRSEARSNVGVLTSRAKGLRSNSGSTLAFIQLFTCLSQRRLVFMVAKIFQAGIVSKMMLQVSVASGSFYAHELF